MKFELYWSLLSENEHMQVNDNTSEYSEATSKVRGVSVLSFSSSTQYMDKENQKRCNILYMTLNNYTYSSSWHHWGHMWMWWKG